MAAGYLAYAGSYTLDGMTVTHHVEMSLFPNWIGTDQVRAIAILENGDLELSTPPEASRSGHTVVIGFAGGDTTPGRSVFRPLPHAFRFASSPFVLPAFCSC